MIRIYRKVILVMYMEVEYYFGLLAVRSSSVFYYEIYEIKP